MRKYFITILFFALAGLVVSVMMTRMHLHLAAGGFESKSFCNISDFVDCDTALASPYAKVAGIPNSEFGLLYYLFFILAILYAWGAEKGRRATLSFLLAGSSVNLAYSVVMAYLSIFRLQVLCLLCLTTYIANVALVLLVPMAMDLRLIRVPIYLFEYVRSIFGRGEIPTRIGVHLSLFVVVIAGGLLFFRGLNPETVPKMLAVPDDVYLKEFRAPASKSFVLEGEPSWGPADARVTVAVFSDFQCPFCRRAAFTLKPFFGELRKKIRFIYINYPLDNACNPAINHPMHPVSCLAAKAALCAHEKGKFWEYHDLVFLNQQKLSRSTLLNLAKEVGISEEWFNVCLVSNQTQDRLAAEMVEGNKFEVRGTPAVYINGRPFRDWMDPSRLRLVVEGELKQTDPVPSPAALPQNP